MFDVLITAPNPGVMTFIKQVGVTPYFSLWMDGQILTTRSQPLIHLYKLLLHKKGSILEMGRLIFFFHPNDSPEWIGDIYKYYIGR